MPCGANAYERNGLKPPVRLHGTVKWFDERRGFGFRIRDDHGPDIFIHARQCWRITCRRKATAFLS
jgi:hypothetical protein